LKVSLTINNILLLNYLVIEKNTLHESIRRKFNELSLNNNQKDSILYHHILKIRELYLLIDPITNNSSTSLIYNYLCSCTANSNKLSKLKINTLYPTKEKLQLLAKEMPILMYNSKNYGQNLLHFINVDIIPFNPFFFLVKDISFINKKVLLENINKLNEMKKKVKSLICEEIQPIFKNEDFTMSSSFVFFDNIKNIQKDIVDIQLFEDSPSMKNSLAEVIHEFYKVKYTSYLPYYVRLERAIILCELNLFTLKERNCYDLLHILVKEFVIVSKMSNFIKFI